MNELTFILILAGIGILLLLAMYTYYKHHKKINDEIENFNHHSHSIDDVLLNESSQSHHSTVDDSLMDTDLPGSFSASRNEKFDINQFNMKTEQDLPEASTADERELVDGVYINSKRVVNNSPGAEISQRSDVRPPSSASPGKNAGLNNDAVSPTHTTKENSKNIKVVYDPLPEGVEELMISHTVLTKGEFFSGKQLYQALNNAGLHYGEMNVFHYPGDEKKSTYALFSVANVIEPGTFDLKDENMKTPGISLFMRLPTRIASHEAYEKFIQIARNIATELDAELCDETRSKLTQQAIAYKKEQISKLNFAMTKAQKLAKLKS